MIEKTPDNDELNFSVADRVLAKFVDAVAEEEDLAEIAARLKLTLFAGDNITEAALRRALFGEAANDQG